MRAFFVATLALALVGFGQISASAQSEQIFCGRILGYSAATSAAPGSFVIVKAGESDRAPLGGTYIAIPAGTQFQTPGAPVWVCVRANPGGTSVPVPGSPSGTTHTFVAYIPQGAPGYQPEPTAMPSPAGSPATGGVGAAPPRALPGTSTEADSAPFAVVFVGLAALAAASARVRRRVSTGSGTE